MSRTAHGCAGGTAELAEVLGGPRPTAASPNPLTHACRNLTYLRKAGLKRPGISNHALRHTADTLGYLHTGDLRAVQDFLGHADPSMTAKYAHVVDTAKKNPTMFIPAKVG